MLGQGASIRPRGGTIAGFLSKDKAILTNFGLQIPLFVIGIYKIIF